MKNITFILSLLILLYACNSDSNNANKQKSEKEINKNIVTEKDTINEDITAINNENEKLFTELYESIIQLVLPSSTFKFNELNNYSKKIDFNKHAYLRNANIFLPQTITATALANIPTKTNFKLIVINYSDTTIEMSDNTILCIFSKDGNLLDKLVIKDNGGMDEETSSIFLRNNDIIITKKYFADDESIPTTYSEAIYRVSEPGRFAEVQIPEKYMNKLYADFALNNSEFDFIIKMRKTYYSIKSSADIANFMTNNVDSIVSFLNQKLQKKYPNLDKIEQLKYIEKIIPGINISFTDEGGGIGFDYNYYYLAQKAQITPEKDDNLFFEAYNFKGKTDYDGIYDTYTIYPMEAFECSDMETCYSSLGEDLYSKLFKIETALKSGTNFTKQLMALKAHIFYGLGDYIDGYKYSKQEVTSIVERMENNLTTLTEQEEATLQNIKKKLNSCKKFDMGKGINY